MSKDPSAAVTKPRSRCLWSPEERTEWVRLLEASGQGLTEFCRENGLPESTVSLWRKHQREPGARAADNAAFVEMTLPPMAESMVAAPSITIRLSPCVAIDVPAGTDAAWLGEVVRRLRMEP